MKSTIHVLAAALLLAMNATAVAQGPPPHLPAEVLADVADPARVAYLSRNVVATGPVTGGFSFDFPADFYEGRLFLLGESHGSAAPSVFDLELLTHLNTRIGLVDYVAELDPVQAHWLNRYLATGDEALLARVFAVWNSGSQWANTAYEDKIRAIRALNLSLPEARRIRVHGIDAIQDWPLLADMLQAGGATLDRAAFDAAKGAARARVAAAALKAAPDAGRHTELLAALERQASGAGREQMMFANYTALVQGAALGDRPAYGLWGAAHVLQAPVNGSPRLAALVRGSTLPASSRLRSIVLYALDSAVQFPIPLPTGVGRVRFTDGNVDGPVVKLSGSSALRGASRPDTLTVFRVDGDRSPYANGQELIALRSSMDPGLTPEPGRATTDYMQYVGVYRGSDWAPPRAGSGQVITP